MPNLPMPEGLTVSDLECVMLDVPSIEVRDLLREFVEEDDYFYGDIPELKYAQGPVAETVAHITLLFGIHPKDTYVEDVMTALEGWAPAGLFIRDAGYFPSSIEGQDYKCLVLNVIPTAELLAGRRRLEQLDYTSTYSEYKPHITLAYLKSSVDIDLCIEQMNAYFSGKVAYPTGLNLGLDDE